MKSVTLCCSKKYAKEIAQFAEELRKLGVLTFEPNFSEPVLDTDEFKSQHVRKLLFKGVTLEHFEWVKRADVCYIYNAEDYCGTSVSLEMGYAHALGKIIVAKSANTQDPCRDALIDFVAETPAELAALLGGQPYQQVIR